MTVPKGICARGLSRDEERERERERGREREREREIKQIDDGRKKEDKGRQEIINFKKRNS